MQETGEWRHLSIMVDYLFGRGVSRAIPRANLRLVYSRRSGRMKLAFHAGQLFATVKPNGAMALSAYGATLLSKSPRFRANCVQVADDTAEFVTGGKSVYCKFVKWAGRNIHPKSEVAIVDSRGRVLGVGMAVLNGRHMTLFKSGVAVKVRVGLKK